MRRYFRNRKLQKHVKHYVDPNAIRDDKDDATSYLKDIAGLATILGVGATGGALLPNGRVYAAQTSVDPKSQVVGSVSDFIKSGASDTTGSKSDSKTFSISASEDKTKSTSASKSTQLSQSLSKSLSQSISQSESLSHSLSESESALNSLSLAKSKEKEAKSNKQATSTSHKSDNKASQSETANVKKSGQNNRRSAENSLSNNSTSANQEQSSTYASTSNDITTNLQASLNLSNDLSSLSNLPLAFNSVSSNNSTSNNSNSQLPVTLAANFMTLAATDATVAKPDFTGTALLGYIGTDGKYVSGSDISYTSSTSASSLPNLAFRLSTANNDTTNSQQFFVMIPKGFKSSVNDFSQLGSSRYTYPFNAGFSGPESFSSSEYSVKDLGEVGPNGEQLFSITLTANPNWGNNFGGQFKLTLDPTVTGQYSYNEYTAPLVSELASDGQGWNNGNFTGFTIDGKHVDVVNTEGYASSIQYAVNQALKPTFTGTATLGNLSNGTFVSANSTNYTADTPTTDLPTLNVRLSTNGTTTVDKPQFIVAIPKGFTATGNSLISSDTVSKYFGDNFKGTNSFSSSDYSVESIGTNSNGEELYLVKLNFNPSESNNKDLGLQFKLALDSSAQGSYTYNSSSTPLVSELASDGQSTAGTATITANGKTYDVVRSSNATDVTYYINNTQTPTFSGTAWFDANGKVYNGNSATLPTYTFRLSTYGNSTIKNPKFILMIPAGFTATKDDITFGAGVNPTNVQDLGNYGPNGEKLFEITLSSNPVWSSPTNTVKLTLDPQNGGSYKYSYNTAPLVSELAGDANQGAAGSDFTYTFKVGNDKTPINVVKSQYPVNEQNDGAVSYTVQAGSTKLDTTSYNISNLKVTPYKGETINDAGYEQLHFTFTPTTQLKSGDYFDVQLGLPNADGSIKEYDTKLGNNLAITTTDGTQVGTAYNMGTYYRIVFNANAAKYTTGNNHPSWNLKLSWGNPGSQTPSISTDQSSSNTTNLGTTFVYKYTNDLSLNGTKFAYTPTNDVTINGQRYASGLHIQGQYVYDGQYLKGNDQTYSSMVEPYNRIWYPDNKVGIATNWYNRVTVNIATNGAKNSNQNTSNNFDITVSVGKNDVFNYQWATDEDLATQIKDHLAKYVTNDLSNTVDSESNVYLNNNEKNGDKVDSEVTVTHTDTPVDASGRIQRVYHIKLSNPNARLDGSISPLTVSSNEFTMPSDIKTYQEDYDHLIDADNFNGADTSNKTLLNALEKTPIALMKVTNNTTGKDSTGVQGQKWAALIRYDTSGDVKNAVDPTNTRTATLEFVNDNDPANPITIVSATNTAQGTADSKIDFSNATDTLAYLEKLGYSLEKVVNNQTGKVITPPEGVDLKNLTAYPYGNLIDSPNKFTVYLHYTDIQSISASQSVSNSISNSYSIQRSESRSESLSISEATSGSISRSLSNSIRQSESTSRSLSQSESLSHSTSQSESLSNSFSQSESLSNSLSQSESLSNSLSESESLSNSLSQSESLSNSLSQSESLSNSLSESESLSNSLSQSESLSNSLSQSESLSNSLSQSESLSNSLSQSESLSNSLSNSLSQSESLSNSLSQSESLSNSLSQSESLSNSLSQSESLSNSLSQSESLSNSLSQSESLSNSLSQSESLSNSLSQSESLSNSLSQSESLSNSLSQSESLSNSLSQSESLSNSLSQSESLSNSLSQSESLSNSLSQSESLSNSLSQSESLSNSLSNSLSQSESLSNSLSQSESLSNTLSQSESLSNSLSQSESLSNSLSESESLSNTLSQSESLSNTLSQSESLSNSLSQSESLSNSLSQSESLSNSLSQSESLSNSLSQSESLSNTLSQSESLSNSLSQSESLSNSLSQSESLSNSLSQSESLSNSLSQSESLSNSLSESKSLSNSFSQSESLSNSLSESESLSNSLSQSESLSNSLSQSESLSNSLSESESLSNSLSNSLSQSESLSNSLSQSESLSNSLSQSESLSNSLSQSESLSNTLSQSESLSNSLSQSESLSNSLSQSESLSNSLSQSESMSNSLSQSESLSNSLSQSESLSNSLSQSESLSNSLSQSESMSNSLSESESLSNSLNQSESLSNSLSQSESLSNSLSQSESLSKSLSQSESLSNLLSQSESLSNSLSESESLSNSLSNSGSNTPRHSQGSTSQSGSLSNSLSESEASISNSISQSTSISTHSEVIESTSETNSNTNNSESINSTTNPSISRPAESVSEQTSVNITPEKQPAESTEQQVSAKKHRVRTNTRRKLPQTGASTNSSSLLGLLATAVGGLLGLRRKKNRKRRR